MTTVNDIVTDSMTTSGIVSMDEAPSATDINKCYRLFQRMMAQWQRKRWLIWCLEDHSVVANGSQIYTVGIGGDINIPRPDRLERAYLRQLLNTYPNQVDTPMDLLQSMEDYSLISLKSLTSLSFSMFYDPVFPTGVLYPWPIPNDGLYELHILVKAQLGAYTSLAQVLVLPPEYEGAIEWNLAERIRAAYRLPPSEDISRFARDALNVIRNANTQIPRLQMPRDVVVGSSLYNIYSDMSN